MKYLELRNGSKMPILGLGTWKSDPNEVYEAVRAAINAGYRHIDCAAVYGNEKEVGKAITESLVDGVVRRDELWVTSKLWNTRHGKDNVIPALKETLSDLRLEYLDLYLIHWPVPLKPDVQSPSDPGDFYTLDEMPLTETWKGMEAAADEGLVKNIGVSNFGIEKLKKIMDDPAILPAVNQVEMHPYHSQKELVKFCHENKIHLTAYSPLGSSDRPERLRPKDEPVLLEDKKIRQIADEKGITPAQVLISWQINRNISVIPKSVNEGRIKENFDAWNIELSEKQMSQIDELNKNRRYIDGSFWVVDGGPHTIESLWK